MPIPFLYKVRRWGERFIRSNSALFLLPLSWVWKAVSSFRHFLYDSGALRQIRVSKPVVSIGNIAVGGTGKTPLVIALAHHFAHRRIAILSRGYGGDEIHVLRRHLPHAKFYEDPNRVRAAKLAIQEGAEILFLDDGFQHRKLWRNLDLLILRSKDLNGRCLPAGELRDPLSRIQKADVLFFADPIFDKEGILLETKARRILTLQGKEIPSLQGERVGMFCGIGNPERFKKTLVKLGALIGFEMILADHEPIGQKRLYTFYEKCKQFNVKYLVCTEKDVVKIAPVDLPIVYIEIESVIAEGVEEWQKLIAKIDQIMNN